MVRNAVGLRSERGPILIALMLSIGVVAMDATILSTAVASVVRELGGFESFPWLFSVYLLAQTVSVSTYAKLADMFGRKSVLLFGIALFLISSILCGIAWDMPVLIAFRALQGLGAGALLPTVMTIAGDIYTVAERATAQGYLASVWAVAAVAGPVLGGVFAEFLSWRWIFFINVPICLAAGALLLRSFGEVIEPRRRSIDYTGAILLTAALTFLLLGILQGRIAWSLGSPSSIGVFAASLSLFAAYARVERRAVEPVLPLSIVTRRIVLTTGLTTAVMGVLLIGLTSFVPTFLQGALGVSPIVAGLSVSTVLLGWPITSALSGRIYLRFGFRATVVLGASICVAATLFLVIASTQPTVLTIAIGCFLAGLGGGFTAAPSLIAAQASVPWNERGVVTGVNSFLRSLGSTIGVAVLGSIATATIAARGGGATDPAAIAAASTAVYIGLSAFMAIGLLTALLMPRTTLHIPLVDEAAPALPAPDLVSHDCN